MLNCGGCGGGGGGGGGDGGGGDLVIEFAAGLYGKDWWGRPLPPPPLRSPEPSLSTAHRQAPVAFQNL